MQLVCIVSDDTHFKITLEKKNFRKENSYLPFGCFLHCKWYAHAWIMYRSPVLDVVPLVFKDLYRGSYAKAFFVHNF